MILHQSFRGALRKAGDGTLVKGIGMAVIGKSSHGLNRDMSFGRLCRWDGRLVMAVRIDRLAVSALLCYGRFLLPLG